MELDVTGKLKKVIVGATGINAIIQQVQIVCATQVGSLPLDRAFGIESNYLDMPLPVAKARAASEIISGIQKFVAGISVISVSWKGDEGAAMDGKLIPIVRIKINES